MPPDQDHEARAHRLTATTLAAHHYFQCDLYLYNSYYGIQSSKDTPEPSQLLKAAFKRGNDWESQLYSWLDDQNLLLRVVSSPLDGSDIRAIIELDDRDHFYITGLSFYPPIEAFKARYEQNGFQTPQFGVAKPDLLELQSLEDGTISWQILDAKASMGVKTSHHAQIYFYHRCMESLLSASGYSPMGTVSIWLLKPKNGYFKPSFEDIKSFSTSLLIPTLDDFLFHHLPTVLLKQRKDVKWHFNPLCRTCPFEKSCRARAVEDGEFGSMANISIEDVEVLRTILDLERPVNVAGRLMDIEDLDLIVRSKKTVNKLRCTHPSSIRRAQKLLALPTRQSHTIQDSPVTAAALLGNVQVIKRRSYTFPKSEDVAIIISLINDPSTMSLVAFCISIYNNLQIIFKPSVLSGKIADLVLSLADVLQAIMDFHATFDPPLRTQCYVFSSFEKDELQKYLINTALTSDPEDEDFQSSLRLCIGAICEGAALLCTSFQPTILSGVLMDFLSKKGERTRDELKMCLGRLQLSQHGSIEEMRLRIQAEVDRLKSEGNRIQRIKEGNNTDRPEVGLLPRVVVVKRELERLLALPIPGYWNLPESFSVLCPKLARSLKCPTDEVLFELFLLNQEQAFKSCMECRNDCIYNVITSFRNFVSPGVKNMDELLINEARVLTSNFMDICKQDHLRKLFFMHQFEILAKLKDLWKDRIEGCPDAPILEYRNSRCDANGIYIHFFKVLSGTIELSADKDRSFFDYVITEDTISSSGDHETIPIEAFFDDLCVFNMVFPLSKFTKDRWSRQPQIVQDNLATADVVDLALQGDKTIIALRLWNSQSLRLTSGRSYRLSPRLVDFNLIKVLSTLLELDLQVPSLLNDPLSSPPFLQLITDPQEFSLPTSAFLKLSPLYLKSETAIHALFRELQSLNLEPAESLMLKPSQRRATRRILSNRLAVIWGPPGTGKTYTLAASILRLLEIQSRYQAQDSQIIFLTAMTHAAIDACLTKLNFLRNCYRRISSLPAKWLDAVSIEHIAQGSAHLLPKEGKTYIYAGTVFQLYNFCKRSGCQSNCIVIDEAGQLSLGLASLVLRSLQANGRIIVAGDNEQLAPILTAEYPILESCLFGSVLDCLMRPSLREKKVEIITSPHSSFEDSEESQISTIVQLIENFRLNADLGEFVSTIYSKKFKPQKSQARKVAVQLQELITSDLVRKVDRQACEFLLALSKAMLRKPQKVLRPPMQDVARISTLDDLQTHRPISLALIRIEVVAKFSQMSYENHVRGEACLAAALVNLLRKSAPNETIFVATPHRIQRHAVKEALKGPIDELAEAFSSLNMDASGVEIERDESHVKVDTIERLQGSEAAFVICLFSYPPTSERKAGLEFLLQRRRLNVAISRARTLCILITSNAVLNPGPKVFANGESMKGFTFLKAFESRAWSADINIDLNDM